LQEKSELTIIFKFCQPGNGRIMIANSKANIYQELYEWDKDITEEHTHEVVRYVAKPGFVYVKI
jgi:hypothetical protein